MNNIDNLIEKFLNGEISANEIESKINEDEAIVIPGDSINYGMLTKPLNKKYYEITGNGISFDLTRAYPPAKERLICLIKAIENKRDVEYYYNEYWKKTVPKHIQVENNPEDRIF